MVGVKVIAEKGVEFKVWKKEGKHRIYFTLRDGSSKNEIGNYDLVENRFFSDRKFSGEHWDIVEQKDNPQALIIIGDKKKIFVGPSSGGSSTVGSKPKSRKTDSVQERITLGMCINNATVIISQRLSDDKFMGNDKVVESIYNLADELLVEYKNRYS